MYLLQTKQGSRATGGPQYYFHDLSEPVLTYLRAQGAVRVALVTPYGATKSDFFAVGKDHKLVSTDGKVTVGKVGHDRIQRGIGEAIRHWYQLSTGDFTRIDVEVQIVEDIFYVRPLKCTYASPNLFRTERPGDVGSSARLSCPRDAWEVEMMVRAEIGRGLHKATEYVARLIRWLPTLTVVAVTALIALHHLYPEVPGETPREQAEASSP